MLKMTINVGLTLLTLLASSSAAAQAPKANKALGPVQAEMKNGNYQGAMILLDQIEGQPDLSAYDKFVIAEFRGAAAAKLKDYPVAAKAFASSVESEYMPATDRPARLRVLAQLNYQLKNFDQAASYANKAITEGEKGDELYLLAAQAYYLTQRWPETAAAAERLIALQRGQGKTPTSKDTSMQLLGSACLHMGGDSKSCSRRMELAVGSSDTGAPALQTADTLPVSAQADVLKVKIIKAFEAQRPGDALAAIEKYHALELQGVKMPPVLLYYEARAAKEVGKTTRAKDALAQYLKIASASDPHYQDAVTMLASLN